MLFSKYLKLSNSYWLLTNISWHPAGSEAMKQCAAGNFTDGPGADICKPCTAGSYCPSPGTTSVSIKQCDVSYVSWHVFIFHVTASSICCYSNIFRCDIGSLCGANSLLLRSKENTVRRAPTSLKSVLQARTTLTRGPLRTRAVFYVELECTAVVSWNCAPQPYLFLSLNVVDRSAFYDCL